VNRALVKVDGTPHLVAQDRRLAEDRDGATPAHGGGGVTLAAKNRGL
jgi:hypothetical protein